MERTRAYLDTADPDERRARFVASTEDTARDALVIEASGWELEDYRANPVLLWAHDHSQPPIGRVADIRVEGGRLIADVEAGAPEGEYEFADVVWRMIRRGLLRAVSVGYLPRKMSNDGRRITAAELLELSVVPVPADPNALAIARSIAPTAPVDRLFQAEAKSEPEPKADAAPRRRAPVSPRNRERGNMDYAERLRALEAELAETQEAIDNLIAEAEHEDRDFSDAEGQRYAHLTEQADSLKARKGRLQSREAEHAAARAQPVSVSNQAAPQSRGGTSYGHPGASVKAGRQRRAPGMLPVHLARASFKGGGNSFMAAQIADHEGDAELAALMRATSAPADTTTTGWAAELIENEMGQFLDLLRPASIFARLAAQSVNVTTGKVTLPKLNTGIPGGFFDEGSPIPVKQGVFGSVELEPYKMGVITTATQSLLTYSTPDTDRILLNTMIEDTAKVLDGDFIDDDNGSSGIRPAGLRHNAGTRAATASGAVSTVLEIDGDVNVMMAALDAINAPQRRLAWVMTPANARALAAKQSDAGVFPYKREIESEGKFKGIDLVTSTTAASGVVLLVDLDLVYKGNLGMPRVDLSRDAVLHMENTSPEQIVSSGTAAGGTVQSMFQTDSVAMRLILPTTWVKREDAGVQVLTSVSW